MKRTLIVVVLVALLLACSPVRATEHGIGALYAPSIGLLRAYNPVALDDVANTWLLDDLGDGVAMLEGTGWYAYNGAMRGRLVLAGHTPGGFDRVHELAAGDVLYVIDPEVHRCSVTDWLLTDETDARWVMPTDTRTLTLLTCEGDLRRVVNATCE